MKAKIYFSNEDIEDMMSTSEEGLWNTWTYTTEEGVVIEVELIIGSED